MYQYDDGSTISTGTNADGSVTVSSTAATDNGVVGWSADNAESRKFGQFYPEGVPWWQSLATYGATRAIDAHYMQATVDKTAAPATFAGQNGRTYTTQSALPGSLAGVSPLVLIGIAAALFFALK